MINLTTVSDALKNLYIEPIREHVNLEADALASRILQTSDNIVGYKSIVRAAQIGANGGVGAGTETGALPSAGENLYVQLNSDTKNLYGTVEISDKIMKSATGANAGSFVNALTRDIETLVKTLKWNLARQIYGDGSGKLATFQANASATATPKLATGQTVQFLLPGLKVDHHAAAGTVTNAGLRILDVDFAKNTIRVDKNITTAANDYLTIQGSGEASGAKLELTGMGALFDTTNVTTLYGLTRANYSWLNPYLNTAFGAITEQKLQDAINVIEDAYNAKINHINAGNDAYGYYMALLNQRRAINDTMTLEGGHRALLFNGIPLTRNKFMPRDTIDLYDTSLLSIDQVSDWEWFEGETRQILQRKAGYPVYEASLAKYCDLMCVLPAGLARLSAVAAPATTDGGGGVGG